MRILPSYLVRLSFLLVSLLLLRLLGFGQGRVVINEFMPWSSCNTTSEYVELMNFGPGPIDIGCYVVTNGQYAVTIPANTILRAGEYYVLSGQNVLPAGCGNKDSSITVDLNWTSCNCTDKPIPTTGDGMFQDGGGANEKVVLLSPSLSTVDAVSRSVPVTSSVSLTSSSNGGACLGQTFDLDLMNVRYEAINIATGIDNSYSRRVDGDCGWVKTTDISAGAPNKTGSSSSAAYSFSTLSASECNGTTGSISIAVSASDVPALFPMTYTVAYDSDSNGIFDSGDLYTHGVDSSAPSIDISNLAYGRYRITIGSASGCNLQSFDFFIFNCYGVVLPYRINKFMYSGLENDARQFRLLVSGLEAIRSLELQAKVANRYVGVDSLLISPGSMKGEREFTLLSKNKSSELYRVKLVSHSGAEYFSHEAFVFGAPSDSRVEAWPNPTAHDLHVQLPCESSDLHYTIVTLQGQVVSNSASTPGAQKILRVPVAFLPKGYYVLILRNTNQVPLYRIPFLKN